MGLNSFYNSGSDVELLKSLEGSVVADQDELMKAMNKAGLVQKEVQVQGKNGTFTRKQWVKAGESSSSSEKSKPSGTNIIDKKNGTVKHTDSAGNSFKTYTDDQSGTVNMVGKFTSDSKSKLIEGMQKKGYEVDKEHTGKLPDGNEQVSFKKKTDKPQIDDQLQISGLEGAGKGVMIEVYTQTGSRNGKYSRRFLCDTNSSKVATDAVKQFLKPGETIKGTSPITGLRTRPSLSDIQGYGYDSSTVTGDPTYLEIGKRGYFKIGKNKWQYNPSQGSALGGTYTDAQISDMVSKTSEEVKVMPSAKKNGNVTFKDYLDADKAGEADAGKTSRNDKKVVDAVKTQYIDNIYRKGKGVSDSQHESLCKKIAKQCGVSELDVWYEMTKQFTEFTDELDDKKSQQSSSGKFKPSDFGFRAGGQETADLINDLDNSVGVKKISNGALGYGTATLENGESVKFESPDSGKPQLVWHGHIFSNVKDLTDYWSGVRKPQKSTTLGQKLSKEDAKKKTQSFTSSIGKTDAERNAFMNKVKAQGITWKEQNDNGTEVSVAINWMRCCMAMNKHFANGGTFDPDKK